MPNTVKPIRKALTRTTVPDISEAPDGSLAPAVYSHAKPEDEEVTETRETSSQDQKSPASKLFEMDDAMVFALLLCASLLIGSPLPLLLFPLFLMAKSYAKDSSRSSKETVTKTVRRHSEEKAQEKALKQARDEVQSSPEIGAQASHQAQPIQLSPQIHLDAENLIKHLQELADKMARAKNDGERKKLAQDFTRNITNNYYNIHSRGVAGNASPQTRPEIQGLLQHAEQFDRAPKAQRARMASELMERLAGFSQNQDFRQFFTNIQGAASKGATHIHHHTHKHFHQTSNLSEKDILRIVEQIRPLLPPAVPPAQGGGHGADSHAENQGLRGRVEILQREVAALRGQLDAARTRSGGVDSQTQTGSPTDDGTHTGGGKQSPAKGHDMATGDDTPLPPAGGGGGTGGQHEPAGIGGGNGGGDTPPAAPPAAPAKPPVTPPAQPPAGGDTPPAGGGTPPAAPPEPAQPPARPSGQQGPLPNTRGDQASASLNEVEGTNINSSPVIRVRTDQDQRAEDARKVRADELSAAIKLRNAEAHPQVGSPPAIDASRTALGKGARSLEGNFTPGPPRSRGRP